MKVVCRFATFFHGMVLLMTRIRLTSCYGESTIYLQGFIPLKSQVVQDLFHQR